jgi:hypothetical protein
MKFMLTITLGNEAMQTGDHVAQALRETAERVEQTWGDDLAQYTRIVNDIFDANGNNVGRWEVGTGSLRGRGF